MRNNKIKKEERREVLRTTLLKKDISEESFFATIKKKEAMSALKVPARARVDRRSDFVEYVFAAPVETLWSDICIAVREACKRHPNYHIPVDNGGVCGRSDREEIIPIDTLGKWLFGTPGYRSHKLLDGEMREGQFVVRFRFPNEAPPEVRKMLESLTPEIIQKNCQFWGNEEYAQSWVSTRGGI